MDLPRKPKRGWVARTLEYSSWLNGKRSGHPINMARQVFRFVILLLIAFLFGMGVVYTILMDRITRRLVEIGRYGPPIIFGRFNRIDDIETFLGQHRHLLQDHLLSSRLRVLRNLRGSILGVLWLLIGIILIAAL